MTSSLPTPVAVAVLLATGAIAGCTQDDSPVPSGFHRAGATIDSAGGSLEVPGYGVLARIKLTLPPGALAPGQAAKLTATAYAAPGGGHPDLGGATFALRFNLGIDPPELRQTIEGALDIEATLDPADPSLTDTHRQQIGSDPLGWARDHLLLTALRNNRGDQDIALCSASGSGSGYDFGIGTAWASFSDGLVQDSKLRGPYDVLTKAFHVDDAFLTETTAPQDADWNAWVLIDPVQTIPPRDDPPHRHPHIGPIRFEYYPISVKSTKLDHRWPASAADEKKLRACLPKIIDAIADRMAVKFPPILITHDGQELPFKVQIYDYTANPSTDATANYPLRTMYLPSLWLDPAMYPSETDCLGKHPTVAKRIGVLAHEMFHWQQGAYLSDQNDPALFRYHNNIDDTYVSGSLGEHVATHEYRRNHWWREGTAEYFMYEMVKHIVPPGYQGLGAYPLDGPAWREVNGELKYEPKQWSYAKGMFFKYLFDDDAGSDELAQLDSLMRAIGQGIRDAKNSGTPDVSVDENAMLWKWVDGRSRDYRGFVRELLLLRGCSTLGMCPNAAAYSHPFARKPALMPALYGRSGDADYWSRYVLGGQLHYFDDEPFLLSSAQKAHDNKTIFNGCGFDSIVDVHVKLPDAKDINIKSATAPKQGEVTILPYTIQHHLTSLRIDVTDNLPYMENNRFVWRFHTDPNCHPNLVLEGWRRGTTAGSLAFAGESGDGSELSFTTEKDPDGNPIQYTSIIVANTAREIFNNANGMECKVTTKIVLDTCPCATMPIKNDGGGPDDNIMYCSVPNDNDYAFCDDKGFYVGGLLTPEEHEVCWLKHPQMSTFCHLPETKP